MASPGGAGSHLELQHYLEPFGFWFSICIVFLICGFGMLVVTSLFSEGAVNPITLLLPPSAFVLAVYSILGPFWREVSSSRALLIELLELQETQVN